MPLSLECHYPLLCYVSFRDALVITRCSVTFPSGMPLSLECQYPLLCYVSFRNVLIIRVSVPAALLFSHSSSETSFAMETRKPGSHATEILIALETEDQYCNDVGL